MDNKTLRRCFERQRDENALQVLPFFHNQTKVLDGFEQHQKGSQRWFVCGMVLGQETLIKGRRRQLTLCRCALPPPIGDLFDLWHDGSFLPLTTFPLAGFAFGCFAVVGDVAFQAP